MCLHNQYFIPIIVQSETYFSNFKFLKIISYIESKITFLINFGVKPIALHRVIVKY